MYNYNADVCDVCLTCESFPHVYCSDDNTLLAQAWFSAFGSPRLLNITRTLPSPSIFDAHTHKERETTEPAIPPTHKLPTMDIIQGEPGFLSHPLRPGPTNLSRQTGRPPSSPPTTPPPGQPQASSSPASPTSWPFSTPTSTLSYLISAPSSPANPISPRSPSSSSSSSSRSASSTCCGRQSNSGSA